MWITCLHQLQVTLAESSLHFLNPCSAEFILGNMKNEMVQVVKISLVSLRVTGGLIVFGPFPPPPFCQDLCTFQENP